MLCRGELDVVLLRLRSRSLPRVKISRRCGCINKFYQYYRTGARNVQLKIDEAFAERAIPANDSVRLLDQTVDGKAP